MFAMFYERLTLPATHLTEKPEIRAQRGRIRVGMILLKIVATAELVHLVAQILFAALNGSLLWATSTLLISLPIALIAVDLMKAANKGFSIASDPIHFTAFNHIHALGQERINTQWRMLLAEMVKDTVILKYLCYCG